jgi:transposase
MYNKYNRLRMISKSQYRRLYKMINEGKSLQEAANKSGLDPKTARKYLQLDNPFEKKGHDWKTHPDAFEWIWPEIEELLVAQPGLEAKTLFAYFREKYPDRFEEKQLRTFQRRVSKWKGLKGNPKEVFFDQIHYPGDLCSSDFTSMNDLKITLYGRPFPHLLYHFVLTYSNWESVTICYTENLESLSEGLQNALWQLGGVPKRHRSDRMSAAINNLGNAQFTARYEELLKYYGLLGEKTQPGCPHENGDVEQSHYRLKKSMDQALMLRGSRDFDSLEEYQSFLRELIRKRNASRKERWIEEEKCLNPLPETRLPAWTEYRVRVSRGSTIRVKENTYSVPSSLINKEVEARLSGTALSIWYQGTKVEEFERLPGSHKARIDYRHIIDWLRCKPGAFEHYRYKEELFPTSTFRATYDILKDTTRRYIKEYLEILRMAAKNGERGVETILKRILRAGEIPTVEAVRKQLEHGEKIVLLQEVLVGEVNLEIYDQAFLGGEV